MRSLSRFTNVHGCGCPIVPSFVKESVFAPIWLIVFLLLLFQRSVDCFCVGPFLGSLCSAPVIYLSILLSIPDCLDYYGFTVSLEVG